MGDTIGEALTDWERVTEEIASAFVAFDQSRLDARSACGEWTNRQLMAHIATGYAVRLGWLHEALEGERASREAGDDANARMVASLGREGVAELVVELRRRRGDVAALIRRLTPELLAHRVTRSDGRVTRLGDALAEFSAHDVMHTAELRAS